MASQSNSTPKEVLAGMHDAFDFFNRELFAGKLPQVMIAFTKSRSALGTFQGNQWVNRDKGKTAEILMNPQVFHSATPEDVLSTLVHEMCHLEQHEFGKPPKSAYHNKEWAAMMRAVGLQPSTTGKPGGKPTGPKCSHYIEEGGRYASAVIKFFAEFPKFRLYWAKPMAPAGVGRKRSNWRSYKCPTCSLSVWGKENLSISCDDCGEALC